MLNSDTKSNKKLVSISEIPSIIEEMGELYYELYLYAEM